MVEQDGGGWSPVGAPPPPPSFHLPWGELTGGLNGILKKLKLEDWDSGDILLLLIVLFLFLEGDNLELAIALGLVLIMGLGDAKEKPPDPYGA